MVNVEQEVTKTAESMRRLTKAMHAHMDLYRNLSIQRRAAKGGDPLKRAEWNRRALKWRDRKAELLTRAAQFKAKDLGLKVRASSFNIRDETRLLKQLDEASARLTRVAQSLGGYNLDDIQLTA